MVGFLSKKTSVFHIYQPGNQAFARVAFHFRNFGLYRGHELGDLRISLDLVGGFLHGFWEHLQEFI
jgi:hypothetical protein